MDAMSLTFCQTCATRILATWQGWPHKNVVPMLPHLEASACATCGGTTPLRSDRITWYNYHGEFNTGLPDYWLLKIDGDTTKWGLPYYSEGMCPRCHAQTVVSEMAYPNGKHERMHNCQLCGLIRVHLQS